MLSKWCQRTARLLCPVLLIMLLVGGGAEALVYGDVNGDGTVNAGDALLALQYSVHLVQLHGDALTAADVDGTGEVNAADALRILQYSVKLIGFFPVENDTNTFLFCSDVHLCHLNWYGLTSDQRMEQMIRDLNAYYDANPYRQIVFLGDYSLDFWAYDTGGSWVNSKVSNTERFVNEYASRLKTPYYMVPGNHEQYSEADWQRIVGTPRQGALVIDGYLLILCDTFSGNLDPSYHSDGTYVPTDLAFVRQQMEAHPGLPVLLCSHYFDLNREPAAFFDFIKKEKRITALFCGHDHIVEITDLGKRADHVCLYHDGNYSYTGGGVSPLVTGWGFAEVTLWEDGVQVKYVEPATTLYFNGETQELPDREKAYAFFPRRDR